MVDRYLGEIRLFGGNYAPDGWAVCAGQLLSVQQYSALFSLIGAEYGGDGRTTFALPDLRGRIMVGAGAAPGLTPRAVGQIFGSEDVSLIEAEMPNHKHAMMASTGYGTSPSPADTIPAKAPEGGAFYLPNDAQGVTMQTMYAAAVEPSGQGAGHTNMMPWLTLYYIIALTGTYPMPD